MIDPLWILAGEVAAFEITVGAGAWLGLRQGRRIERKLKPALDLLDRLTPGQIEKAVAKLEAWFDTSATEAEVARRMKR